MLNDDDRKIADKLKRLMTARGIDVHEVIVFGSRARGDADSDSDLDVLVLSETLDTGIRKSISRCAWEVGYESGVIIQTVAMTRDQAEDGPERSSLLMLAVAEEGVRI